MNQNKDNEYEILETNSSYPSNGFNNQVRYPLANDPKQALQNMNYKDWIEMCENGLDPFVDAPTAVSTGLIIAGTMLGAFAAPITAAIIISFGTLLPLLIPEPNNPRLRWEQFMEHGETLLNTTITNTVREQALGHLQGFTQLIQQYQIAFDAWQANKNPSTARLVAQRLENAHASFTQNMPQLSLPTYKTALLNVYVQAANLHLNLLSQGYRFADEWNAQSAILDQPPIKSSNIYLQELRRLIRDYSNHCSTTYDEGLTHLKYGEEDITWNIYNRYRRDMTLTVLDMVALFPNYDPDYYPMRTHTELTREVYTDAIIDLELGIDTLENDLTRRPDLFTWLSGINFYTRIFYDNLPGLTANNNDYRLTNSSQIFTSATYGPNDSYTFKKSIHIPSDDNNVFSILITHEESPSFIQKIIFHLRYPAIYDTERTLPPNNQFTQKLSFSARNQELPPTFNTYSHRLSYVKTAKGGKSDDRSRNISYGWTHYSVNETNTISNNTITQIPAVKGVDFGTQSRVIQGPGHIGGNLVDLKDRLILLCTRFNSSAQPFVIRIRYASNDRAMIRLISQQHGQFDLPLDQTFTGTNSNLRYENFAYVNFPQSITLTSTTLTMQFFLISSTQSTVLIDRIEFIPITQAYQETLEKQKLETIQQTTNEFFTSDTKDTLKTETTDYKIDQTAVLTESISEEMYPQEKMVLLDTIKHAKQLSESQNLLQNGDFQSFTGWTTNNDCTIQTNNPHFKENAMHMPGARTTEINNTIFPTFLYQKIDESQLKPYTRYIIRGFIETSKDVEVLFTRYNKEIDTILNVSNDLSRIPYYERTDVCESQSHLLWNPTEYSTTHDSSNNQEEVQQLGECDDPHAFSFSIDTGNLDYNENLGIRVQFKISNPNGYATMGNLEVIEERSLTEEEVQQVNEKENSWKQIRETQQKETEIAYSQAHQAVANLFMDEQHSALKCETTIQDITTANHDIDKIPYVYHEWLPQEPGMNYDLYINLKNKTSQAYTLYQNRNFIQNGDFSNGLTHWEASPDVEVQTIDDSSILVIPNWSDQVSQQTLVQPNHQYLFRVVAKKEGAGNGSIHISDCENHIDTLTFTSCDDRVNSVNHMTENYITKTMSITPQTKDIRIDIGETAGTFHINSIELICTSN